MNADVPPYSREHSGHYYGESPYAQQPPPPPLPGSSSRWGPTSMGIDPALAAGLAYLFGGHLAGILPIVWLILEKRNRFIRFNAVQALLLIAAYLVGLVVAGVVVVAGAVVIAADHPFGAVFVGLGIALAVALSLALLVFDVWGIIAGFSGKFVKFPLIGELAVRLVGGPPIPAW